MENLSSLFPTDNLYKFVATTGLLLIVFCFVYPDLRRIQYERDRNEVNGLAEEVKYQRQSLMLWNEDLDEDVKSIQEDLDKVLSKKSRVDSLWTKKHRRLKIPQSKKEEFDSLLKVRLNTISEKSRKLQEENDKFSVVEDSVNLREIRLKTKLDGVNIGSLDDKRTHYSWLFITGEIVGLIMVIWGFRGWYKLGQKLQDELLQLQLEEYREKIRIQRAATEE